MTSLAVIRFFVYSSTHMPDRTVAPLFHPLRSPIIPRADKSVLPNGIPTQWVNIGTQEVIRIECIFPAETSLYPHSTASLFASKMMWEGTQTRSSSQISQTLDLYGAFTDTVHTPDYYGLVVYTMPRFLPNILPVLADVLYNASLPEKEWNSLKSILLEQLKVNQEQNSWIARTTFRSKLFGEGSRYGFSQTEDNIRELALDDLKSFYKTNISEAPFYVFASGKVEDQTLKLIETYLGQHPTKPLTAVSPAADGGFPGAPVGRVAIPRDGSSQYTLRIGKRAPRRTDKDFFSLLVTNEILGGYFGSRLMKNIREEKGLTYGISSYLPAMKHASYFMIATDVNKDSLSQISDEIKKEILTLQNEEVSETELARVKKVMAGEFVRSIGTAFEIGDLYQAIAICDLPDDFYDTYLDKIRSVTAEQIQEVARNFLNPDSMMEVVVG
jgi:zinc protease